MKLNEFFEKLDEQINTPPAKYPDNDEWHKDYETILDKAIELYKPGAKGLAKQAIAAADEGDGLEVSMAGDDVDYIKFDFAYLSSEDDDKKWWDYANAEATLGKSLKQRDAEGSVSSQFHTYMQDKTPANWKAVEAFYDSLQ